jgi:hypothetical protein
MTNTTTTEPTPAGSHAVTHLAYHVREGKDKGFWTRVGVAWQHRDEKGFNVKLDCLPVDGRITLRVASEAKE